jgi:hypothetical protein
LLLGDGRLDRYGIGVSVSGASGLDVVGLGVLDLGVSGSEVWAWDAMMDLESICRISQLEDDVSFLRRERRRSISEIKGRDSLEDRILGCECVVLNSVRHGMKYCLDGRVLQRKNK